MCSMGAFARKIKKIVHSGSEIRFKSILYKNKVQHLDLNDIIEGCLSNDRDCQKALYDMYASQVLGICRRYASHDLEAEDMLQEGFLNLFTSINQYNGSGPFESWMRRVIVTTCLRIIRKRSARRDITGVDFSNIAKVEPKILSQLSAETLLEMINQLPEGYKKVFNLFAIEGYKHHEISEMLGIHEGTSRSQLLKARKILQKLIGNTLNAFI